jgi:transposase
MAPGAWACGFGGSGALEDVTELVGVAGDDRVRILIEAPGLGNRPGSGRKRRITGAQRSRIIALARSVPPGRLGRDATGELSADDERGPAQWTLDTLAQAARDAGIEVQRSQVRRILLAEKVRWRRTRSWATSTDPEFAPKGPRSWNSIPPRRRAPPSSAPTSSAR